MNYIKPEELNKSYIGRKLHLDFYNVTRNWFGVQKPGSKIGDKIVVEIKGKKVTFIENRSDDGYNNWFSQQYLESVEKIDGFKLKIKEFELLEINKNSILVKSYFVFVDDKNNILKKRSFTQNILFAQKIIVEYLFKAKD